MKIMRWKESQVLNKFSQCENLKDVIEAIERECESSAQLVCSIQVNGLHLEEDDEQRFAQTKLVEINEIEVETGSLREIIRGVFNNYRQWLPSVQEIALDASENIRSGNFDVVQKNLTELLDSFQCLVQSLIEMKKTVPSLDTPLKAFADLQTFEDQFPEIMKQLVAALENKNYTLAADFIEYDLHNFLDKLKNWVAQNISEIGSEWSGVGSEESGEVGSGEINL